ncbi:xylose isomerase [Bacillus sp. FJAT-27264]|uniref:sugar phosphate isomerase/epimerase family protein n=1 Tax=Paenibacillus sp. (strain DSM 101736 / FJAT-27264) TaxID=1850362 RepID=UPI000807BA0C|nr:sugar phosphate isomerase/epimerase [Bacillus sp. FJAT-27264]OBZ18436.1 xylose isomerase [Bacillus sp. FJAT-27264]
MLRGLTTAGLGEIASNEEYIRSAAEFGFQAVDLNPLELIQELGQEKALELLESTGITIGSFSLDVDWRSTEENFRAGLEQLVRVSEAAAALNCKACCTYILPSTDLPAAPFMIAATRRLRLCADILGAYGISLGLEFVGSNHLRTQWANPFIWTMEDTLEWMEAINSRNVGLLLDSYHWYTNGLTTDDLLKLKPEQITHAHINDAKDLPIPELQDGDRLYPGEGVIDLAGFLESLVKIGYKGVVAQEVLAPGSGQTSQELLARSKAGFDKVFAPLGL